MHEIGSKIITLMYNESVVLYQIDDSNIYIYIYIYESYPVMGLLD